MEALGDGRNSFLVFSHFCTFLKELTVYLEMQNIQTSQHEYTKNSYQL